MYQKHFKLLAEVLNFARPVGSGKDQDVLLAQWMDITRRIAWACRQANGRFDYGTFYSACGMSREEML
jgi:hypothetical protein